ncbi:hypothetical protein SMD22_01025 (plasmid) [Brevibacillus halotolerans]|nr:hypothetical protein SMD22_01025 [Brevibacillus halotolerans]
MDFNEAMKKLFKVVFEAYVKRKEEKVLVRDNPQRVVRGTNVSNSSVFENELALLLHTQLHDDYQILIDYPIIFPGQHKRIVPDILILKHNTIQMILELKIDLGYEKKGWDKHRDERLQKLKEFQKQTGYKPFNEKNMQKEDKVLVVVPDQVEYATIIFCCKNGTKLIEEVITNCKNSECEDRGDYPYFILLRDRIYHPNDFTSFDDAMDYISTMKAEYIADWSILESYLRKRLVFRS